MPSFQTRDWTHHQRHMLCKTKPMSKSTDGCGADMMQQNILLSFSISFKSLAWSVLNLKSCAVWKIAKKKTGHGYNQNDATSGARKGQCLRYLDVVCYCEDDLLLCRSVLDGISGLEAQTENHAANEPYAVAFVSMQRRERTLQTQSELKYHARVAGARGKGAWMPQRTRPMLRNTPLLDRQGKCDEGLCGV
jgi:hypothetical protein